MKLSFVISILFLPFLGLAQIHVNCGGVNQVIPHFTKGGNGLLKDQPLVDRKILEPITSSASAFEIRILYYQETHLMTTVIKCLGDTVSVAQYDSFEEPKKQLLKDGASPYINSGAYTFNNDTTWVLLYKKAINLKPTSAISWNKIFAGLIKNHFFDLPSQAVLDKLALKERPKAVRPMDSGFGSWYEIKVGNQYRYMMMTGDYVGVPSTAKYVRYKQEILNLLSFR